MATITVEIEVENVSVEDIMEDKDTWFDFNGKIIIDNAFLQTDYEDDDFYAFTFVDAKD